MEIINLTTAQSDKLYEVVEIHMKWYQQFYENPPAFGILLEGNHHKLHDLVELYGPEVPNPIDEALKRMAESYEDLIAMNELEINMD